MDIEKKFNNFNILLFFILFSILVFIYFPIFQESVLFKQLDFQWSPSKLVWEGINHYEYMLEGNREKIIGSQFGEYLHGLYILIYPFTLLTWENAKIAWFIFNFVIAVLIPLLICKKFKLQTSETILIIFFFLASNVTKAHMVIGQQSILILFFFCLPFISNSKIISILSGISYLKYSIGYVFLLNLIINKKTTYVLLSLIIPILGWLIYSLITDSNLLDTVLQPFQLAIQNHLTSDDGIEMMPKNVFLFSFFDFFDFKYKSLISIIISLTINIFFIFKIRNLNNELQKLSCLLLSTLIFFPHYPHNYVIILPLLIYSIKTFEKLSSKISFIASIYFLSFFRAVEIYMPTILNDIISKPEFLIQYLNTIFLFLILIMNIYENKIFNNRINDQ